MSISSMRSSLLVMTLVAGGCFGTEPAHAERCTMIGNVLHCESGLSATEIGNVWHLSDGRPSSLTGEASLFRDGPSRGVPAFERRPDARCKKIGTMEFCAQPVHDSPK